jgi:hypothetical protein
MAEPTLTAPESDDADNGDEFRLEPLSWSSHSLPKHGIELPLQRSSGVRANKASAFRRNPHKSLYATDLPVSQASQALRAESKSENDCEGSREPRRQRHYASIAVLQKAFRLCGYVIAVTGVAWLILRFIHIAFFASEQSGGGFPAFLVKAFWLLVGVVFLSATLLASSEFFQLLMDVQADTLSSANERKTNERNPDRLS